MTRGEIRNFDNRLVAAIANERKFTNKNNCCCVERENLRYIQAGGNSLISEEKRVEDIKEDLFLFLRFPLAFLMGVALLFIFWCLQGRGKNGRENNYQNVKKYLGGGFASAAFVFRAVFFEKKIVRVNVSLWGNTQENNYKFDIIIELFLMLLNCRWCED